jgi:hypothetical protein
MSLRSRLQTPTGTPPPPMVTQPVGDYLLVPRSTVTQILAHIEAEHERFPARRLSQTMRILRHVLGDRNREIA